LKEIEKKRVLKPQLGMLFWSVLRPKMGSTSPCSGENLQKNSKVMLAGNAAKTLENIWKFLLVQNINFICKNLNKKIYF
jgi:hypothetical protein